MVYMFLLCGFFQHCKTAVLCGYRWTVLLAPQYSIVLIDCGLFVHFTQAGRALGLCPGQACYEYSGGVFTCEAFCPTPHSSART